MGEKCLLPLVLCADCVEIGEPVDSKKHQPNSQHYHPKTAQTPGLSADLLQVVFAGHFTCLVKAKGKLGLDKTDFRCALPQLFPLLF